MKGLSTPGRPWFLEFLLMGVAILFQGNTPTTIRRQKVFGKIAQAANSSHLEIA
jgi:hypothetical protein